MIYAIAKRGESIETVRRKESARIDHEKILFISIVISILSACASPNYNYVPEVLDISEPPIDSINVAYVGDPMLRQGTYSEHDAILLKKKKLK